MPQPVHLRSDIRRPLRSGLVRPEFPDHQLRIQIGLRFYILVQYFQQLAQLSLVREPMAAEDLLNLFADDAALHDPLNPVSPWYTRLSPDSIPL